MEESFVRAISRCVGFGEQDCANLRAVAPYLIPRIPVVVDCFFAELSHDRSVRAVFVGADERIERLRHKLQIWVADLVQGPFDQEQWERHFQIGAAHAQAGIQQQCIFCGMESMRREIERLIRNAGVPEPVEKLHSLRKLLMLELAVTLEGYKESYAEGVRESERSAVEEKLTRAQHLARIGQLAASLAHEIKNPLAGISGAIQIIRETMPADDPHQPIISEILGQIDRLDATVKDLLLYARPTPPQRAGFPLTTIVSRVLNVLREEPELQRIRVACDASPSDSTVYADDRQIEQLIINLLLNAAQASDDGGVVELAVAKNTDDIRLIVKDKGRGMTPDVRKQAFEPFFTTKAKGTGLGLSICRRIVEAHGGRIALESDVGRGTTVTVDLPRRSKDVPEDEQP